MSRLRLLPLVIASASALLVLKTIGLVTEGGFALTSAPAIAAGGHDAPAEDGHGAPADDGHGAPAEQPALTGSTERPDDITALDPPDDAERELLEKLGERRRQLDSRAEELDQREALLEATERRIEQRISELRSLEAEIQAAADAREQARSEEMQGVVSMYESMRPRDAARIFDGMDIAVMVEIAQQIKPKKLAVIVAEMTPSIAQQLTVELAERSGQPALPDLSSLPKIGEDVGETLPLPQ
jgi:flagellar motility protein MotE (MotC chaperone)